MRRHYDLLSMQSSGYSSRNDGNDDNNTVVMTITLQTMCEHPKQVIATVLLKED